MIDRQRLVRRHNVVLTSWHPSATLGLGNGDFAVNVDATGLQTFPGEHSLPPRPPRNVGPAGLPRPADREFTIDDFPVPLGTQSSWGWYQTDPGTTFDLDEASSDYATRRGTVRYADRMPLAAGDRSAAATWLFTNPRRLDLGRVGLAFPGTDVRLADIDVMRVELDLWTGSVHSRFAVLGRSVEVTAVVDPDRDVVAVRVESSLVAAGQLVIDLSFPPQHDPLLPFGPFEQLREASVHGGGRSHRWVERIVGDMNYTVTVAAGQGADAIASGDGARVGATTSVLEASFRFGPVASEAVPSFDEVRHAASEHWTHFWASGAAVSFEGSTDTRAAELERRVVLSQYLTAVHGSGRQPPQESGLIYSTWSGKFHLEMHWWHAAHFVLWGRPELLERSFGWYREIMPRAEETARQQGYRGVRWPKQVGPDGREAPSEVGVFLVWQQPHLIYFAELLRIASGDDPAVVERYADVVFATAEFIADLPDADDSGTYHLGPPIVPAQESYFPRRSETADPTFELAYWHWALHTAQEWRLRRGLARDGRWDEVLGRLAPPTVREAVYTAVATEPYTIRDDHPSMLMALGFVPKTPLVDAPTMAATFDDVLANWDLFTTWGWDYPVLAMCATKLGRPEDAVDTLLLDAYKNHYLDSGHVPQMTGALSVYLPANGGLLAAIAMMVAGWEGGPELPGFPDDGSWRITHEGFNRFPADLH